MNAETKPGLRNSLELVWGRWATRLTEFIFGVNVSGLRPELRAEQAVKLLNLAESRVLIFSSNADSSLYHERAIDALKAALGRGVRVSVLLNSETAPRCVERLQGLGDGLELYSVAIEPGTADWIVVDGQHIRGEKRYAPEGAIVWHSDSVLEEAASLERLADQLIGTTKPL